MKSFLIIILVLMSFNSPAKVYIKLDGTTITGHSHKQDAEHDVEIPFLSITDKKGDYVYKYVPGSGLIELSDEEKVNHPLRKNKAAEKNKAKEEKQELRLIYDKLQGTAAMTEAERRAIFKFILKRFRYN